MKLTPYGNTKIWSETTCKSVQRKKHKFFNRRGTCQYACVIAKLHTASVKWWSWARKAIGTVKRIIWLCTEQGITLNTLFSLRGSSIYAIVSTFHLLEEYCLNFEWFSPQNFLLVSDIITVQTSSLDHRKLGLLSMVWQQCSILRSDTRFTNYVWSLIIINHYLTLHSLLALLPDSEFSAVSTGGCIPSEPLSSQLAVFNLFTFMCLGALGNASGQKKKNVLIHHPVHFLRL